MTSKLLKLACAWLCLQTCLCHAQDAEGLSRARRDADNPLRLIIEASKLKPRQKSAEPDPAAGAQTEKLAARAPNGKPAALVTAPPTAATGTSARTMQLAVASLAEPLVAAPLLEPTALPVLAELQIEVADYVRPSPPVPAEMTVAEQAAEPMPEPTQAQALEPASPPPGSAGKAGLEPETAVADRSLSALNAPLTPAPAVALQLEGYVEPQVSDRIRRRLHSDAEVVVNFTVNPDGSVTDASVRSSSDRSLDPIALDAVRQWRYRPIAVSQAHAAQLVFRLRD